MEINLFNVYGLGDDIFLFILFYNIKDYIEENNIIINYYCNKKHHNQLSEFNCSKNVNILEYTENIRLDNLALNMWIGNSHDFKIYIYDKRTPQNLDTDHYFDIFYVNFFNQFLEMKNIPKKIEKLEYDEPKLLEKYANLNKKFHNKYSDLDYLILNSTPQSGQYIKDVNDWNKLIYKLNEKYKIVTTEKVENVNCTCDDNLSVMDIAAISTHSKKIIAVNSGVIPGLFNKYTLNNVEVIYYFCNLNEYYNKKFVKPKNNDINELYKLLCEDIVYENFVNSNNLEVNVFIFLIICTIVYTDNITKWFKKIKKYFYK